MHSWSDLKKHEQTTKNTTFCDIAWKMEKLIPESPKKDGRAEAYLREIGMTPEKYMCNTLVAVKADSCQVCSVCKRKQKTTKFCRLIQNSVVNDIPICTDCINSFIEYNPKSVFDLEPTETE